MIGLENLPRVVTAVGGLGTAAFGLVDASKPFSGVNRIGFGGILRAVLPLTPAGAPPANALSQGKIIATLEANWINGTDLDSQKAIAKSLIKLNLSASNAAELAKAAGVDADTLTAVAKSIMSGDSLTSPQSDVFGRFDLIVTALLDEAYQRSDQIYRNSTRMLAMAVAIILAVVGELTLTGFQNAKPGDIGLSVLIGLLATPLAPIAKDLSTALATAVNTLQLVKK